MKTAPLFVLFLALGAAEALQDKDKVKSSGQEQRVPKDPVKDWKYRRTDSRYDLKTKTESRERRVILQGKEAIPLDVQKKIFDLRGVKANYFTTPQKERLSKEMVLEADEGHYDHDARILKLK